MNKLVKSARPWYKEGMVWMVIAIPMTAVIVGIAFLTTAIRTWDGVVVDDYYKHGKEINKVLVRDRFATVNGVRARLDWMRADGRLVVEVESDAMVEFGPQIEVSFLHPTIGGRDRQVNLAQGPDGRYHGVLSAVHEGRWIIQLGTGDWRLSARTEVGDADPLSVDFEPLAEG
jgi:uncharacterized protein